MTKILIRFSGLFMLGALLGCTAKEELKGPPSETVEISKPDYTFLWVIKPNINIREDNSSGSEKVATLADGDSVIVYGNQNGWYQIESTGGIKGWVRSDLLAPRNASIFRKAVDFVDRLKTEQNIDLFFDKNLQHARVYLSMPAEKYTTVNEVENFARKIITEYQEQVYRGEVTVRVLQPGSDEEYITFEQKGQPNPAALIPVIPFGYLETVDDSDPEIISISVALEDDINNNRLLEAARSMVKTYPISYQKVIIKFVSADNTCRLWFVEDAGGELYEFDRCPE